MNRSARFSVILVSLLLFIYCICVLTGWGLPFAELFFIFSPLLVIWMVLSVIRSAGPAVPELKEDQEWGYTDKEY
jgi:hypothetical protein